MCLRGSSGVDEKLFQRVTTDRLKPLVVWVPMLAGRATMIPRAMTVISDRRAEHFWDGQGALMRAYRRVLGLDQDAWDVYLIYGPDARWDGPAPPVPAYWAHQLRGVKAVPCLDDETFAAKAKALLDAADAARATP